MVSFGRLRLCPLGALAARGSWLSGTASWKKKGGCPFPRGRGGSSKAVVFTMVLLLAGSEFGWAGQANGMQILSDPGPKAPCKTNAWSNTATAFSWRFPPPLTNVVGRTGHTLAHLYMLISEPFKIMALSARQITATIGMLVSEYRLTFKQARGLIMRHEVG